MILLTIFSCVAPLYNTHPRLAEPVSHHAPAMLPLPAYDDSYVAGRWPQLLPSSSSFYLFSFSAAFCHAFRRRRDED